MSYYTAQSINPSSNEDVPLLPGSKRRRNSSGRGRHYHYTRLYHQSPQYTLVPTSTATSTSTTPPKPCCRIYTALFTIAILSSLVSTVTFATLVALKAFSFQTVYGQITAVSAASQPTISCPAWNPLSYHLKYSYYYQEGRYTGDTYVCLTSQEVSSYQSQLSTGQSIAITIDPTHPSSSALNSLRLFLSNPTTLTYSGIAIGTLFFTLIFVILCAFMRCRDKRLPDHPSP